jgi:integrase/recombinase XerD
MRAPAEASGLIGPHLQAFFAEHLLAHKRASPQTIASYRDTFRLLLRFMQGKTGTEPSALPLAALDADAVLAFLDHLERDRGCSVRSRNNRLAAIRSFFRVVSLRVPDRLGQVTQVMAIPIKRGDKRQVHYLSRDEVKALLAAPDRTVWSGRRDHALLLTLYNTGARVSEIIALRREQVRLDATGAHVELLGKGRKERVVPLWVETARVLRAWFTELGDDGNGVAFPSVRGPALSRDGVDHLLHRAVATAAAACPSLGAKKVSPHVLRQYVLFLTMSGTFHSDHILSTNTSGPRRHSLDISVRRGGARGRP